MFRRFSEAAFYVVAVSCEVLFVVVNWLGCCHVIICFWGILKGDRALYLKSRSLERALLPRPAAYEAAALLG